MHGVERGDENRVAIERRRDALRVDGEAGDRRIGERPRCVRSRSMLCSRLYAITGSITLSWKLPDCPAIAIVASLPITCAHDHRDGFRNDRIHLARHDAAAGLQRRQLRSSPRPASGPLFIQRRSLAIFISADRERAQLA